MIATLLALGFLLHSSYGFVINTKAQGCQIILNGDLPEPVVASIDLQPIYPDSSDLDIFVAESSTILLGCPGGELKYGDLTASSIEATCVSGSTFTVNQKEVSLSNIQCSKNSKSTARYTGKNCEENGVEIEVGFELDTTKFIRTIAICFDDKLKTPLYSFYNLTSKIGSAQTGIARPSFVEGSFYGLDEPVNTLYKRAVQKSTVNSQVGLESTSTKYVQDSSDYFLARGHLTAKADFVYASQQRATFQYVNTAPQWQTFNGANWNSVEDSVRRYAASSNLDLQVYTGTYGVTALPHEKTTDPVELYLYLDNNNNVALPIPEIYWKLVYNPSNGQNIVLIGVNNPYESELKTLCEDISDEISWISWSKMDQKKGLSYACSAEGLNKTIAQMPDLKFGDLLK